MEIPIAEPLDLLRQEVAVIDHQDVVLVQEVVVTALRVVVLEALPVTVVLAVAQGVQEAIVAQVAVLLDLHLLVDLLAVDLRAEEEINP